MSVVSLFFVPIYTSALYYLLEGRMGSTFMKFTFLGPATGRQGGISEFKNTTGLHYLHLESESVLLFVIVKLHIMTPILSLKA